LGQPILEKAHSPLDGRSSSPADEDGNIAGTPLLGSSSPGPSAEDL